MEVKVQCDCGQKFKFDVEPVNGQMPWEVNCPVCGASGTEKANQIIQRQLCATPTVPVARVLSAVAPAPAAVPVPSAEPPKPRLSISRPQPAAAPAADAAPPPLPPAGTTRPAARGVPGVRPARRAAAQDDGDRNFLLSVVAVLIGAVIGMCLWHFGCRLTGKGLGFMALITGILAGVGPQILGRYKGVAMGLIAAFVATVAIFTTQFFNAKVEVKQMVEESAQEEYDDAVARAKAVLEAAPNATDQEIRAFLAKEQSLEGFYEAKPSEIEASEVEGLRRRYPMMRELASGELKAADYDRREREQVDNDLYEEALSEAKAVVKAVPNGSEQEFRIYLAKEYSSPGMRVTPAEIDAEDVEYMKEQYPQMRELASGTLTKEQYLQKEAEEMPFDEDDFLNFYVIFKTINIFNIVSIVLGIGAAFLTAKSGSDK